MKPLFLLKLDTKKEGVKETQYLQTDYNNMKYMHEQLEGALNEIKTAYSRRVARNVE